MAQADTKIRGVSRADSGWFTVTIDRIEVSELQTKFEERAIEARTHRDSGAKVTVEVDHRTKERQNGGVWHNWYYLKAQPSTNGATSSSTSSWDEPAAKPERASTSTTEFQRRKTPEEEWQIALSVGAKLAVETLPLLKDQRFPAQREVAIAWAQVIYLTPMPDKSSDAPGAYDEFDGPAPDDIPY